MIPTYQMCMLPILRFLSDGQEHATAEFYEVIAAQFQLTDEERQQRLPSGNQLTYVNRTGWARTHLNKAGLIEALRRGVWKITPRGLSVLAENPDKVDNKLLERFAEFKAFQDLSKQGENSLGVEPSLAADRVDPVETPDEALGRLHGTIEAALRLDLLSRIKSSPPAFFEQLIVELMLKMGYGGSREDAGQVVGKSGDGGIDGVIKQDRLGLDTIYLQAKRWEGMVGRPDVQAFVGSLAGHRAKRGVFITTSSYSKQALEYVTSIEARVILLDGEQLAALMIEHDLGVSPIVTYVVKRVDGDYFEW